MGVELKRLGDMLKSSFNEARQIREQINSRPTVRSTLAEARRDKVMRMRLRGYLYIYYALHLYLFTSIYQLSYTVPIKL